MLRTRDPATRRSRSGHLEEIPAARDPGLRPRAATAEYRQPHGSDPTEPATSWARILQVLLGQPLRRAVEPGLDQQLLELGDRDPLQSHENRGVAVEMRRGEVHLR